MNQEERAAIEAEQYEEALRKLAAEKFNARRHAITTGDQVAMRNVENDLLTYFADSGKLKILIEFAFMQSYDTTGRVLLQTIKDMMYDEAIAEAKAELEAKPSRRPLGDSTVAALNAVEQALKHIGK